jgi:hypothetical protein
MADIKEVWIDNLTLTLSRVNGVTAVVGQGQTFAADGTPIRSYGPTDITANLSAGEKAQVTIFLNRAQDAIQDAFMIADTDLIAASPLPQPPAPPEPLPPVVEQLDQPTGA